MLGYSYTMRAQRVFQIENEKTQKAWFQVLNWPISKLQWRNRMKNWTIERNNLRKKIGLCGKRFNKLQQMSVGDKDLLCHWKWTRSECCTHHFIVCNYSYKPKKTNMTIGGNLTVQMQGPHKLDGCTKPQIANSGLDGMLAGVVYMWLEKN